MNLVHQIDYRCFAFINNLAGHWSWLDTVARLFLNDYFVPTLLAITLLILWFDGTTHIQRSTNQRAVLVGAFSTALANILLKLINLMYHRPRPFDIYETNLLFYQPTDSSLPSNAATLGFSVAAGVWFYRRHWGWALFGLAAVFGLSRIFGGVHYPLDVIAGAALGCGSAWVIHRQKTLIDSLLGFIVTLTQKLGIV